MAKWIIIPPPILVNYAILNSALLLWHGVRRQPYPCLLIYLKAQITCKVIALRHATKHYNINDSTFAAQIKSFSLIAPIACVEYLTRQRLYPTSISG